MDMSRILIAAVAGVLLCASSSVYAATWSGGTGNWIDDSWGLDTPDGSPGDADYGTEDATINTGGDQVTVQAGNSFSTSGKLFMNSGADLIVDGTLSTGGDRATGNGDITVQNNGALTAPRFGFMGLITVQDSATLTMTDKTSSNGNGGTDFAQSGGTIYHNYFRDSTYDLTGGLLYSSNSWHAWGYWNFNVNGGTWTNEGSFLFQRGGAADINILSGSVLIEDDFLFGEEFSDNWNQGLRIVTVSNGTFNVGGDVRFWADSVGGNQSDTAISVIGSSGSITLGGITTGGAGTGPAKWDFRFTPDASGVATITVSDTVPDLSRIELTLNDSDAYPGTGDLGVIFEIPGTVTQATPFTNAAEGAILTFDDEGTTIYQQITYAGGDGNDIELTKTTVSNEDPVAIDIATNAVEDVALVITVSATDADGDTMTFSEYTAPSHGSLGAFSSINASNATVTYTPTGDYNGSDSFVFEVSDGIDTDTGTVSITISPVQDAPEADAVSVKTLEDQAVLVTLTGSDVDGESLTFATASSPSHGSLRTLDNGYLLYTPTTSYTGPDSFTYTANDGTENSSAATVSITVADPATDVDDWTTDRWGLSGDWPGSATKPTTPAVINDPDIVALTNANLKWTDGGQVVGGTGIAVVGADGVMHLTNTTVNIALNDHSFTTILRDNGIINYQGRNWELSGHLRLNDNCTFIFAPDAIWTAWRLLSVTLNGGTFEPEAGNNYSIEAGIWVFSGGTLDVDGGNFSVAPGNDGEALFCLADGLLSVTGDFDANRSTDNSKGRIAVVGTGMGSDIADGSGLQVGGTMGVGHADSGKMQTTMVFNFDDTTGVDYWDIGGNLTLNNGNGNAILEIDLGDYNTGNGDTGIVLFDYAGTLSGTFDSVTVNSGVGPLTPGTQGDLDYLEYAIDYGDGTADVITLYARAQLIAGTVISVK